MRCRGWNASAALWRQRLLGLAARARLGFGSVHLDQRKIIDRPGPGEFGVIKGEKWRVAAGSFGKGNDEKNEVP